jgi:hypothetical protein
VSAIYCITFIPRLSDVVSLAQNVVEVCGVGETLIEARRGLAGSRFQHRLQTEKDFRVQQLQTQTQCE